MIAKLERTLSTAFQNKDHAQNTHTHREKQLTYNDSTNGVARTLKKLRTSKGDYCIELLFSTVTFLFKMGTFLKGKNLPPEGENPFL